ncbi:MAG TPA: hypothetical protein PL163_23580, partial [Leptospiraceae bacterium]|nr:hypothetical protein [Leptospiraceae bacterium]
MSDKIQIKKLPEYIYQLLNKNFIPLNFKLTSVNSLIMIAAMSLMIFIATQYFKKDSELRIR